MILVYAAIAVLSMGAELEDPFVTLGWDDTYENCLQEMESRDDAEAAARKRRLIEFAGIPSPKNTTRVRVQGTVRHLGELAVSSIRLEYGNANMGSYGVLWFLETTSGVVLVSHHDPTKKTHVDEGGYSELWDALRRQQVWTLESDADLAYDDGTVYSLSVNKNRKTHQAVIYAPPMHDTRAIVRDMVPSADQFAEIIRMIISATDKILSKDTSVGENE